MEEEIIKQLLIDVLSNNKKVLELTKYPFETIFDIAIDNKLYDSLSLIVMPMNIDGEYKYYFQTEKAIYDKLKSIRTNEEAINEAQLYYYSHKDYGLSFEEILETKKLNIGDSELKKYLFNLLCLYANANNEKVKIKNSHAKEISGVSNPINSLNEVLYYVEPACQKACVELFFKGIETTNNDTQCVYEDIAYHNQTNGHCEICINYMSLSPANKEICDELAKVGLVKIDDDICFTNKSRIETNRQKRECKVSVPCNSEETIGEVSMKFQKIISQFQRQDILYGKVSSDELLNSASTLDTGAAPYNYMLNFYNEETQALDMSSDEITFLAKLMDYHWHDAYYDEDEDTIYRSFTLYKMHKDYLQYSKGVSMNN